MHVLTLKVPEKLERDLAEAARQRGVNRSVLIRELLEGALRQVTGRPEVSCAELAGDLAGSLRGPADLSTSPRHLKGFGE